MTLVVCVDVGSTYTKAAAVELPSGVLVATASHPTTIGTDVLIGLYAAVAAAAEGRAIDELRVCSSAGGGLRLGVIGYERAITAEAGWRVGLSAGARVVHVAAGILDQAAMAALAADRPDIVLLCGGTDGGDESVLQNATALVESGFDKPVVVACNAKVANTVGQRLTDAGIPATVTANVLPRIGVLDAMPARLAIREAFIRHVIGGKELSQGPRFQELVSCATPDAVLAAVELLADGGPGEPGVGDVVVVDVGGATTDVYSALAPDADEPSTEAVTTLWRGRTVEGDLGVRWNAVGIIAAAESEGLLSSNVAVLRSGAQMRAGDPAFLAGTDDERLLDLELARLALTVAVRRHARPYDVPGGTRTKGRDLSRARLVVGSGGVLRHADGAAAGEVLAPLHADVAGGWRLAERAESVVDRDYVLAAAGLLAPDHPDAAMRLLRTSLLPD
ncbi:MAG: glutamate mutase L [Actinomycetes bacterium]